MAHYRALPGPARVRTIGGGHAWLITRYEHARTLGADPRIGKWHPDPARASRLWHAELFAPLPWHPAAVEDHRKARAIAVNILSHRKIQVLRPRAEELCGELLDRIATAGPPADLCTDLARPLASTLLFEHLGIAPTDWAMHSSWSDRIRSHAPAGETRAALNIYLTGAIGGATGLFITDYETAAARIGYGLLALLVNKDQRARLAYDYSVAPMAVEEVMRFAVPGGSWVGRYALEDIDFQGSKIAASDLVVFAFQAANRDETVFSEPNRFLIERSPNPHLGFGHGTFYCPGAGLSRLMLETVLRTIFDRLPGLQLAVPVGALRTAHDNVTGGLAELPVTW